MAHLICLDDGHGDNGVTPGKRSPKLSNGSVMYENSFNKVVVKYLKEELLYNGFRVLEVAPTDADTPLKARTDLANKSKADMYVSVHANANAGQWFDGGGIETFHYPGSATSKKLAECLHKELIKGSPLRNRGVKSENFHVLRETNCVAALVELGFMDSKQDINYLLSDNYRRECAREIARGICNYYGVAYKEKQSEPKVETRQESTGLWRLQIGAFSSESNAKKYQAEIKAKYGLNSIIKKD